VPSLSPRCSRVTFTARRDGRLRIRAKVGGKLRSVGARSVAGCRSYSVRLPKGTTKVAVSFDGRRTVYKVS